MIETCFEPTATSTGENNNSRGMVGPRNYIISHPASSGSEYDMGSVANDGVDMSGKTLWTFYYLKIFQKV